MEEEQLEGEEDQVQPRIFSLDEARGWVLDRVNNLEVLMNKLISAHYSPSHKEQFENVVLNSSIVSFGGKLKILKCIGALDDKIISKLQKLSSIRNGFAHTTVTQIAEAIVVDLEKGGDYHVKVTGYQITVMNSNGDLRTKDVNTYFQEFRGMLDEVHARFPREKLK